MGNHTLVQHQQPITLELELELELNLGSSFHLLLFGTKIKVIGQTRQKLWPFEKSDFTMVPPYMVIANFGSIFIFELGTELIA